MISGPVLTHSAACGRLSTNERKKHHLGFLPE